MHLNQPPNQAVSRLFVYQFLMNLVKNKLKLLPVLGQHIAETTGTIGITEITEITEIAEIIETTEITETVGKVKMDAMVGTGIIKIVLRVKVNHVVSLQYFGSDMKKLLKIMGHKNLVTVRLRMFSNT